MAERTQLEPNVAIVDDNLVSKIVLTRILDSIGIKGVNLYRTDFADRIAAITDTLEGDKALTHIFLDESMPNGGGLEILREILKYVTHPLTVIPFSGTESPNDLLSAWKQAVEESPLVQIYRRVLPKTPDIEAINEIFRADAEASQTLASPRTQAPESMEAIRTAITDCIKDVPLNRDAVQTILGKIRKIWEYVAHNPSQENRLERIALHVIMRRVAHLNVLLSTPELELNDEELKTALRKFESLLATADKTEAQDAETRLAEVQMELRDLFVGEDRLKLAKELEHKKVGKKPWNVVLGIANLVNNALSEKVRATQVRVEYELREDELLIHVIDNGDPFPPDWAFPAEEQVEGATETGNGFQDIRDLGLTMDLSQIHGRKGRLAQIKGLFGKREKALTLVVPLFKPNYTELQDLATDPSTTEEGSEEISVPSHQNSMLRLALRPVLRLVLRPVRRFLRWVLRQLR